MTVNNNTYHDQGALDTKDGITRKPLITFWIKGGDEFSVPRSLDRDMEMIRPHVMTIEVKK